MLLHHDGVEKGCGIVELSCLACLYHGHERFVDSEAYMRRLIERDHAKHGPHGAQSLFRRALPSGLSILDIVAGGMSTPTTDILREEFDGPVIEHDPDDDDDAAAEAEGAGEANGEAAAAAGEADGDASEEWLPPCAGFKVCSLCKGASGPEERWGAGKDLHWTDYRYPLAVCAPCKSKRVAKLAREGDEQLPRAC